MNFSLRLGPDSIGVSISPQSGELHVRSDKMNKASQLIFAVGVAVGVAGCSSPRRVFRIDVTPQALTCRAGKAEHVLVSVVNVSGKSQSFQYGGLQSWRFDNTNVINSAWRWYFQTSATVFRSNTLGQGESLSYTDLPICLISNCPPGELKLRVGFAPRIDGPFGARFKQDIVTHWSSPISVTVTE